MQGSLGGRNGRFAILACQRVVSRPTATVVE